jgi:hypothetical protein
VLGNHAECTKALIDKVGVDAFAVVRADELVPPAAERGHAETAQAGPPRLEESWSAGPMRSWIRPRSRPLAAIAASAFVTSSGMICVRSIPACAKFSRK